MWKGTSLVLPFSPDHATPAFLLLQLSPRVACSCASVPPSIAHLPGLSEARHGRSDTCLQGFSCRGGGPQAHGAQKGLISIDYEAEVEDDIEPIFRRGEIFEQGVESLVFLRVKPDTDPRRVQEGFNALSCLAEELEMLVVQHTSGANFCSLNKGYTHGMVTRFLSEEAKNIFTKHSSYLEIMESKIYPITLKMLSLDYSVASIGTTAF